MAVVVVVVVTGGVVVGRGGRQTRARVNEGGVGKVYSVLL